MELGVVDAIYASIRLVWVFQGSGGDGVGREVGLVLLEGADDASPRYSDN